MSDSEELASCFLEIASWQRLEILFHLARENSTPSKLSKSLNSTNQEIHRNVERLKKSNIVEKNSEGLYQLTPFGQMILIQTKSFSFMSNNLKYFSTHGFANIPSQFIQRVGALEQTQHIKCFVKVQEKWVSIYQNAQKFIYNILFDVPYTEEILNTVSEKLQNKTKIKSIFSESALIPKQKKDLLKNPKFKSIPHHKNFKRKMNKNITAVIVLNDKEASVCFPLSSGEADVSQMFYGNTTEFVKWCFDYFEDVWKNSTVFSEAKIK